MYHLKKNDLPNRFYKEGNSKTPKEIIEAEPTGGYCVGGGMVKLSIYLSALFQTQINAFHGLIDETCNLKKYNFVGLRCA